jgi:hypothetical protein
VVIYINLNSLNIDALYGKLDLNFCSRVLLQEMMFIDFFLSVDFLYLVWLLLVEH